MHEDLRLRRDTAKNTAIQPSKSGSHSRPNSSYRSPNKATITLIRKKGYLAQKRNSRLQQSNDMRKTALAVISRMHSGTNYCE